VASSSPGVLDSSLHTDDIFEELKGGFGDSDSDTSTNEFTFNGEQSKDASIDLDSILQEMEEERDESAAFRRNSSNDSIGSGSISIGLNDVDETDKISIGSKLQLDDLPSSRTIEWGRSMMGSFKKMGSSLRLLRRKDSKPKLSDTESIDPQQQEESERNSKPRKKVVRFKKFDTIRTFYKSFSNLGNGSGERFLS